MSAWAVVRCLSSAVSFAWGESAWPKAHAPSWRSGRERERVGFAASSGQREARCLPVPRGVRDCPLEERIPPHPNFQVGRQTEVTSAGEGLEYREGETRAVPREPTMPERSRAEVTFGDLAFAVALRRTVRRRNRDRPIARTPRDAHRQDRHWMECHRPARSGQSRQSRQRAGRAGSADRAGRAEQSRAEQSERVGPAT